MTAKTAPETTLSTKLIGRWEQTGNRLATLAAEFPEEKYESRPVEGVRTFADVLRHVAFWNRYVADSVRGKKADDSANELPKAEYSTKARILEALHHSAADAAAALKEQQPDPDRAEMVMMFIEHTCEHYGQLAMYARWIGMVPPASRA